MRTKFIGLDGYGEIESVEFRNKKRAKKKSSFAGNCKKLIKISHTLISETKADRKKAEKPTRLEQHYANKRREGSERLSRKAVIAAGTKKARAKTLRHSGAKTPYRLRSKAALGVAAACVAVVMGIVVSTSAFGAVEAKPSKPAPVAAEKKAVSDRVSREVYTNYAKNADDREILTEAWGLYVDDVFLGACLDEDELRAELQKVLDDYKAAYDDETTDEFANNVNVELGSFRGLQIGDAQSIVQNNLDKFSISLSTDLEYTEDIPYETIVEYDDTQYTDYREVTQKGITGKQKTIIRATYVDGVETDTEVTDVITVKEKQDKYVVKGTLEYAEEEESEDEIYDDSASSDGSSTGSFIWPMPYTTNITSGYGARWGTTHTGIDIAEGGIYGQSIIASDGGVVEWAGSDDSGYGTYVIINHQNGYKTLYGHCSELFVSEGQYVSQGEAIAAVGSTGFSTGPHLHFEVRTEDGDRLDPQNFV